MKRKPAASKQVSVTGNVTVETLSAQVEAALKLLDQETADGIIGAHSAEYDTLIRGANAVMAMEWAVMKTHGLRQTRTSLKTGSQALSMVLTLVHYAYAAGVRRGRAERQKPEVKSRKSTEG